MEYPDVMSESDTTSTAADLEALEALQADISELERIEELLDRFNIFEAIGFVGQEVKHSHVLGFPPRSWAESSPRRHLSQTLLAGVL
jgi:hypothetical protein